MIKATEIQKSFGKTRVLNGISMNVDAGEIVAMIGPSGCGKTTFLRCLNGLETIDSGSVQVGDLQMQSGVNPSPLTLKLLRIRLGMVFQQFQLFPHFTVLQNIMEAPRHVNSMARQEAQELAMELLKKMNLEDKAKSKPRDLSGGQQQRVAIARALSMKPQALLFDEPTSALDPRMTGEIGSLIRDLAHDGLSILVVTHDMGFARRFSDRVCVFDKGIIAEEGEPESVFQNPQSNALKDLLTETRY
jgi:ABC-type polar amino acid transport system ATPase subunit